MADKITDSSVVETGESRIKDSVTLNHINLTIHYIVIIILDLCGPVQANVVTRVLGPKNRYIGLFVPISRL